MMTLPADLEAKFQGFGMEEFFQGHHGKGGENIIRKPEYWAVSERVKQTVSDQLMH